MWCIVLVHRTSGAVVDVYGPFENTQALHTWTGTNAEKFFDYRVTPKKLQRPFSLENGEREIL